MNSRSSPQVPLSVVVITLDGGANLVRCLDALCNPENPSSVQIIVAHDDRVDNAAAMQSRFPGVDFLHLPGRRSYSAMRAAGVHRAVGSIVAVTEDQCIPPGRWSANIVEAHRLSHAAIGGPVEKWEPDAPINWAVYLREFGEYMPPLPEGPRFALTDCNVTYKRAALERISATWQDAFNEPEVHGALQALGEVLWLSPGLVTFQQRTFEFQHAVRERYDFGRLYGHLRLSTIGPGKRFLLVLASPVVPFLMIWRVFLWVCRRPSRFGKLLLALPYVVLFSVVWSFGETVSYLTGRSNSPSEA